MSIPEHAHPKPRHIMAVCKRWNAIYTRTPALWSCILVGGLADFDEEFIQEQLERSENHPLDVFLRPWIPLPSIPNRILRLLHAHVSRIRIFVSACTDREYEILFPVGQSWELPLLQVFAVIDDTTANETEPEHRIHVGQIVAPKLVNLSVGHPDLAFAFLMGTPLQSLLYLQIVNATIPMLCSHFLSLIRSCPKLRCLYLNNWFGLRQDSLAELVSSWPLERVVLPDLTFLSVWIRLDNDSLYFFRSFYFPRLQCFNFKEILGPGGTNNFKSRVQHAWHFFREYSRTIENLDLNPYHYIPGNVTKTFVERLVNLTILGITRIQLPEGFLRMFLPNEDKKSNRWICPNLELLMCRYMDIDDDVVCQIVKQRCWSDEESDSRGSSNKSEDDYVKNDFGVQILWCSYSNDSIYGEVIKLLGTHSNVFLVKV